jgi:UDP-N-acetylmuramoyl-tripeptide--D-alanyl-D-alanine ligase
MKKISTEELYSKYIQHPIVCTDTRSIKKDSLFFALKGDSFNGNTFAAKALELGSSYAIIDEEQYCISDRFLLVDDVLTALQELSKYHRKQLSIPVIGITGSNGKTTTKELVSSVLSTKYKTYYTQGNLNNHIGVPLTLLSIPNDCEMAVVEMGANHQKEIEFLCTLSQPNYVIITNIGKAHLEGFGGIQGVIKGKNELYQFAAKNGSLAFVNNDNDLLSSLSNKLQKVTYGTRIDSNCYGKFVEANPVIKFKYLYDKEDVDFADEPIITSHLMGEYNFENILCAVCVGSYFNVSAKKIKQGIEGYIPSNSRSQLVKKGTNTVLMDAYNANPSSMKVALENFWLIETLNKILVLGDMLELGEDSHKEHKHIIELIQQKGFENFILVGKEFMAAAEGKMSNVIFEDSIKAAEYIKQKAPLNTYMLIKGSRGIKMEKVLEALSD